MAPLGLALSLVLASSAAGSPSGAKYAVMPIAANEVLSERSAALFTETLAGELRQQSGADVLTARDVGGALSLERQKQLLGCQSDSCMAEIAGAVGAERFVSGEVAQLGESLIVQVRLLDAKRIKVVAQARRRFRKGTLDDLLDALPAMIAELLAPSGAARAAEAAPGAGEREGEGGERGHPAKLPAARGEAGKPGSESSPAAEAARPAVAPLDSRVKAVGEEAHEFELAVPLAADGVMPVSFEVGPFTLTEVRVRNMPSDEEVRDTSAKRDNSHPKPTFTARSRAAWDADFKVKVTLEDERGKVLMKCDRSKGLGKGETDELNLCWLASIRTSEWPKVKVVRLVGRIQKD